MSAFFSFRYMAVPAKVPPVPVAHVKASSFPSKEEKNHQTRCVPQRIKVVYLSFPMLLTCLLPDLWSRRLVVGSAVGSIVKLQHNNWGEAVVYSLLYTP